MKRALLGFVALSLAVPVFGEEIPSLLSEEEKSSIREAVKRDLKDPDSAKFRWNPNKLHGVAYCGFVNSRNSYGGYVGFSPFMVFFDKRRQIDNVEIADDPDAVMSEAVLKMCLEYGYILDPGHESLISD